MAIDPMSAPASSAAQLLDDPLLAWMLPTYIAALCLSAGYSAMRQRGWYQGADSAVSLVMLIASAVVDVLPKLALVWLMLLLAPLSPWADIIERQWWAWALLFVLDDLCYYLFHRSNHEWRILWAGHVNHHSSRYFNLATALRQGVGERIPKYVYWLPLPLLGFDVAMILVMISFNLFYQFWIHLPGVPKLAAPIEYVLNTPSHHRVHHASNPRYLDRNHGGVLIIWDRLFGTFQEELDAEPPIYGLTKNLTTNHPWTVLSHEYRALWADMKRASRWRDRRSYMFGPPGWQHDGPDRSARALRAELVVPVQAGTADTHRSAAATRSRLPHDLS